MTSHEIRAWADRCEERAAEGFGVGPGMPTLLVAEALRLLADRQAGKKKPKPDPSGSGKAKAPLRARLKAE